jgi:hypothetical protein
LEDLIAKTQKLRDVKSKDIPDNDQKISVQKTLTFEGPKRRD